MSLFGFLFFLHVEELVILVVEFVLQECQFLRWNNVEAEAILKLPFTLQGDEPLVDKGSYVWVDIQTESLDTNLVD